ncbi:biotin-independent malonate decarboxylase subunit beta [Paraburkholderia hospita]|uniref:Malonate decarboxylase subunit beta n=1 Tax=Paraburkholderia hospita TaxID=169430 RepID=A0AAN1MKW6_9BURK|nr:biotin-independent malonate decarboxylase subunit beta [Paraburkholderia hospita]AUT70868.1 biotin-independent malonate decarboxylase subunit beta [Paraburkholderia hospita]EIM93606.1 malonate decarboxylase subunit beta [Paraburkholderia hospita]OUL71681.1 biotin-independent malonate decarboxylase subunit beta [Paraburkholderia hospita]OUL93828.1 biotin-independent malonate decarboxylase subunit beta [Paraburkholderia hospita]SEI25887.1 malonate decarboxylase beta subunit [Paraburkholderia 
MDTQELLERQSFIELDARSRAKRLLDAGSFNELLDPFERVRSPWLARQGIVTQADDGAVVAKGLIDGQPAVVLAIDGGYQGGSMGEVSAAKIAGSLELAAEDNRNGIPTRAVILFETGGVRLQEANLGLAAIAEIHAAIVDLRRYQPVIGITAGPIGCYGGMSISAGLCSYLIGTREARLGLNGPAVIEQEAGIAEFDSRDRPMIWSFTGCEQRHRTGLVDVYAADDTDAIRAAVIELFRAGRSAVCRSERVTGFLQRLSEIDPGVQATPEQVVAIYGKGFNS